MSATGNYTFDHRQTEGETPEYDLPEAAGGSKNGDSPPLEAELSRLDNRLDDLQKVMAVLSARLAPVLCADEPNEASVRAPVDNVSRSPMAVRVEGQVDRLHGIRVMIERLVDRLEV